jgi:O-antigen ligase
MFWFVVPTTVLVAAAAVVATWNASGSAGLLSSAVKSVLFQGSLDTVDAGSDLYRQIEGFNLWVTIRARPLTGFGFGHPYIVAVPQPDISFFQYWQFIPHNSVLWVWIQMGFFGLVAFLFLFARSVQVGARAASRAASPTDAALIVVSVAYVAMFLVFAYVDIVWDVRPAVVLALAIAFCGDYERTIDPSLAREQVRGRAVIRRRVTGGVRPAPR